MKLDKLVGYLENPNPKVRVVVRGNILSTLIDDKISTYPPLSLNPAVWVEITRLLKRKLWINQIVLNHLKQNQ